jgi:hypothetical protein
MSQSRGFGLNGKSLYTNVTTPQEVWCNFTVDSTNGNGYGIRSLKSNGYVESVFMHTTATPGTLNGYTNPNPAVGFIQVRFKNTFNYYLGGIEGQIDPLTSTSTTSVTAGSVYVITSLGTTTLAQWLAAGLTPGSQAAQAGTAVLTQQPSVGQAFVATMTGSIGGTGTVGLPGVPGYTLLTVVGDPNQTISNTSLAANAGAVVILQLLAPSSSSTTTLVPTAPANGTVISLQTCFDRSTVTIDGI